MSEFCDYGWPTDGRATPGCKFDPVLGGYCVDHSLDYHRIRADELQRRIDRVKRWEISLRGQRPPDLALDHVCRILDGEDV